MTRLIWRVTSSYHRHLITPGCCSRFRAKEDSNKNNMLFFGVASLRICESYLGSTKNKFHPQAHAQIADIFLAVKHSVGFQVLEKTVGPILWLTVV